MTTTVGILLDLGNSETRVGVCYGGKYTEMHLSNEFAVLDDDYVVAPAYLHDDDSVVFKYDGIAYANGKIVEREFKGKEIRPVLNQRKMGQLVTKLSMNLVFIKVLRLLANDNNLSLVNGGYNIDAEFRVSGMLPIGELRKGADKYKETMQSMKHVDVILPEEFSSDFKVTDVVVHPEGVVACFAALLDEKDDKLVPVKENEKFQTGYVLGVDIGAGTTEVFLMEDSEFVNNSMASFNIGGNTARAALMRAIQDKYDITPMYPEDIIKTGKFAMPGASADVIDATPEVMVGKKEFSRQFMTHFNQYLEGMSVDIRYIKGVLIVGGGSLPSVDNGKIVSPALSTVLIEYFKQIAKGIERVSLHGCDARTMNLRGAYLLHKYMQNSAFTISAD